MNLEIAEKRYLQQRAQARMRKVPFTITLDEWIKLWADSGKWEQRGRRKDQYCMSRIGDKGGYELGNVFIQLQVDNVKDAQLGRVKSIDERLNQSKSLLGHKHSDETKKKIGNARKGKPANNPKKFQKGHTPWNKGLTSKQHITI
jgi:hypothetical protein